MNTSRLKSLSVFNLLLALTLFTVAQERALGTWKSFMPYGSLVGMCDGGGKVFCGAIKSIFSFDKQTGEIRVYDKSTGLSDIGIQTMSYDFNANVLAVAYVNGNIDLIFNETDIYNIPDIKNSVTTSSISIWNISFFNGKAYVSSNLGISEINLNRKEITNTYIIGKSGTQIKVNSTCSDNSNIYAATDEGIKYAPLSSLNLQNFNSWIVFDSTQNLPQKKASFVASFNNKIYAVINGNNSDTLFEFNGSNWSKVYWDTLHLITSLNEDRSNLYFTVWNNNYTTSGKNGKIDMLDSLVVQSTQGHFRPNAWFDSDGTIWESDSWNGFFKNGQRIVPDGPFSSAVFDINVSNHVVTVAAGGVDDSWGFAWNFDGFFIYKDNKWNYYNQYTYPPLGNYSDIVCTQTVTSRNKTYLGSFLSGLIEFDNFTGNITLYDKRNSILEGAIGDTQRTKISAMVVDQNDNLWIGNSGATKQIKLIKRNGTWKDFSVPFIFHVMRKMLIDRNGQLWAPIRRSEGGILVWSNNGTEDNISDDLAKILVPGEGKGNLPDPTVYSIAEDRDGNIWVGTAQGIAVYYCPGSVLTSSGCDADQIKVERDGYIGYLFGTESVRAIAVDAANRKWIGTTNGLWLVSEDGKKELLKFTVENSPLPNNQITDIEIDKQTGEVFIGTIDGLVSYQGDAVSDCSDCDNAFVYPNPVKPDYNGPIAIKGLTDQAYVKITDVTGTLIYEGKANGCQMIWDGKGYNGQRAKSGVYLVFSSTDTGKGKRVAKILVTN